MQSIKKTLKKTRKTPTRVIVNQKPSLTLLILKTIGELGMVTLDAFFPAKYPQTKLWRSVLGLDSSYKFSRPTFATILFRLQKQGLIEQKVGQWSITVLGQKLIGKTWLKKQTALPKNDGIMRLVIFDVPERERKKRLWLRSELTACNYQLLQKSVWVGYCPLPQEFAEALDYLNLRSHVHIFSVKSAGTLRKEF